MGQIETPAISFQFNAIEIPFDDYSGTEEECNDYDIHLAYSCIAGIEDLTEEVDDYYEQSDGLMPYHYIVQVDGSEQGWEDQPQLECMRDDSKHPAFDHRCGMGIRAFC